MHSLDSPASRPFALFSQLACYVEWLKIEVALRLVLTHSWTPEAWQEVHQHITWLLAERARLRRQGWFNQRMHHWHFSRASGRGRACISNSNT
jgi:hypothetical protein